jgi:hypothetical protein
LGFELPLDELPLDLLVEGLAEPPIEAEPLGLSASSTET